MAVSFISLKPSLMSSPIFDQSPLNKSIITLANVLIGIIAILIGLITDFLIMLPKPARTAFTLSKAADISLLEPIISIILSFNRLNMAINEAIRPIIKPIGLAFIAAFKPFCAGITDSVAAPSAFFDKASCFEAFAFAFVAAVFLFVSFVARPICVDNFFVFFQKPSIPCIPCTRAIACWTFNIACWTSSFSSPNKPIAALSAENPAARLVPTPCTFVKTSPTSVDAFLSISCCSEILCVSSAALAIVSA